MPVENHERVGMSPEELKATSGQIVSLVNAHLKKLPAKKFGFSVLELEEANPVFLVGTSSSERRYPTHHSFQFNLKMQRNNEGLVITDRVIGQITNTRYTNVRRSIEAPAYYSSVIHKLFDSICVAMSNNYWEGIRWAAGSPRSGYQGFMCLSARSIAVKLSMCFTNSPMTVDSLIEDYCID